jgi:hypothetical protein
MHITCLFISILTYIYIYNSQLDLSKLTRQARELGKKNPYKNYESEKKKKNLDVEKIQIAENLV